MLAEIEQTLKRCNKSLKKVREYMKSTTRDEVEWRDCCSLHAVTSSVIYYTHTEKCNLFVLYNKNSNGLLKDFGA